MQPSQTEVAVMSRPKKNYELPEDALTGTFTIECLELPRETQEILKADGIRFIGQLEELTYDELLGLCGITKIKARNIIIRMAEQYVYLKDCDNERDYIKGLLKDYYEHRLTGLEYRFCR